MHRDFADWYRAVSLAPQNVPLEKRWKSVERFAKECSARNVGELARLLYAKPTRDVGFLEAFRIYFKTDDASFPMRDNDAEISVLAAATLIQLCSYDDDLWTTAAATAIIIPCGLGQAKCPINGLSKAADDFLLKASIAPGTRQAPSTDRLSNHLLEQVLALKEATQTNVVANIEQPITELMKSVTTQLVQIENRLEQLSLENERRREESEVLWWLKGGYSREFHVRLTSFPLPFRALVAGNELADLIRNFPGPASAQPILAAAIQPEDALLQISFFEAVECSDQDWKRRLVKFCEAQNATDISPVHRALKLCLDSGGGVHWRDAFTSVDDAPTPATVVPAIEIAYQLFRERLFLNAFEKLLREPS
jgi:hypothetical protein